MSWKPRLDSMVGKTYLRNGEDATILSYKHTGDTVKVRTTGRDYEKHVDQMPAFLDVFKPLNAAEPEAVALRTTVSAPSKLQRMQEALLSTLDRVQQDAAYVPQAEQVSRLVQTGINLAKVELEAIRLARS